MSGGVGADGRQARCPSAPQASIFGDHPDVFTRIQYYGRMIVISPLLAAMSSWVKTNSVVIGIATA